LTIGGASVYWTHWIMTGPRKPSLALLAALIAALAPAGALRADLAASSPFLPANMAGTAGAGGPSEPVELRGIMSTSQGTAYCIYDTAKKTSAWVGLNETGNDFVVKSADAMNDAVTVTVQGRDIRLVLRAAKVASSGAASAGPPASPALASSVVVNPTPGDEQKRLDAVAAEVRRRRQEREKAAQAPQNGAPGVPAPAPASPNR
jgi:hypothetical protein